MCTLNRYVYIRRKMKKKNALRQLSYIQELVPLGSTKEFQFLSLLKIYSHDTKIYIVFAFAELIIFCFLQKGSMDG